jgi:hypothetical protein
MEHRDAEHEGDRDRLSKLYAEMDEAELEDTAYHAGRFNDVAREALKEAIAARGLNIEVEDDFKRPRGVTVLALLVFLNSALCLLVAALAFVRPELIPAVLIGQGHPSHGDLRYQIGLVVLFDSVGAIVNMVIGFGLWLLRWWARWALLVCAGIFLARWGVGLLLTLLLAPRNLGHALISISPIGLLINAAILWLLTQSEVERAFEKPVGILNWP